MIYIVRNLHIKNNIPIKTIGKDKKKCYTYIVGDDMEINEIFNTYNQYLGNIEELWRSL